MSSLFASGGQKYQSFSLNISPSDIYSGLISFGIDWFEVLIEESRVFSSTTIWKHHFFSTQPKTKQQNMVKSWMLEATRAPSNMSQETSQDIVKLEAPPHAYNPNNPWKIYIPASNMHISVGKEQCLESEHCLTA